MCSIHALRSVQASCLKWSEAHTCETNAKWKHRCVKVFPSAAIERSIKSQNNRLCLKSPRSKFAKYPEYCVSSHYDFQFTHTWHFIVWGFLRIAASGIRQCHSLPICFLTSDLTNQKLWLCGSCLSSASDQYHYPSQDEWKNSWGLCYLSNTLKIWNHWAQNQIWFSVLQSYLLPFSRLRILFQGLTYINRNTAHGIRRFKP